MSLDHKHSCGASHLSSVDTKDSYAAERLHAAADTPTSAAKQASHAKNKSDQKDVDCLDQFMQDNTDSEVLKQGKKDQKDFSEGRDMADQVGAPGFR